MNIKRGLMAWAGLMVVSFFVMFATAAVMAAMLAHYGHANGWPIWPIAANFLLMIGAGIGARWWYKRGA